MNPKKGKEFIPEVAKDLGIPEEDLTKVVTSYYKYLRKNLVEMTGIAININKLGVFYVKERKTLFKMEDYQVILDRIKHRKEGPWKEAAVRNLTEQIERYQRAVAMYGEKYMDKIEFYKKKQKYRDDKAARDMAK